MVSVALIVKVFEKEEPSPRVPSIVTVSLFLTPASTPPTQMSLMRVPVVATVEASPSVNALDASMITGPSARDPSRIPRASRILLLSLNEVVSSISSS